MNIVRICPMCNRETAITVSDDLREKIDLYNKHLIYIQEIPLPPNEREFIKSGYCMVFQKLLFGN